MATRFYLRDDASDLGAGALGAGNVAKLASPVRGSGLVASDAVATVAGPTGGVIVKKGGNSIYFTTKQLNAVALGGIITVNLWMEESNVAANAGPQCNFEVLNADGSYAYFWTGTEEGVELSAGGRTLHSWTFDPSNISLTQGQRLAFDIWFNDAGGNMVSGHTVDLGYNGSGAAADGDSWIEFPETIVEAGITVALGRAAETDTAQAITASVPAAPPAPETTRVARARVWGEASWTAAATGVFVIGTSQLDGPDTLGATAFDDVWGGPDDELTGLKRFEITQGRDSQLANMDAGSMTLDVRDPLGRYNPENPDSPIADEIPSRLHPVRLLAELNGVIYRLFVGWIRSVQWEPQGRRGMAQFECVDLFYRLSKERPTIAATGPTTTGVAIGLILDAIDYTDPALRSLSTTGHAIPNFSADGLVTGLQLIEGLLDADRGLFYIVGGVAVFESTSDRAARAPSGEIADKLRKATPGVSADSVIARQSVTRVGGVRQTYEDAAVALAWGSAESDAGDITTPYLTNDAEALSLATYIVNSQKTPIAPVREVRITNDDEELLEHILARVPGDRMTLSESHQGGGMRDDYYIERRTITGEESLFTASWIVSKSAGGAAFIVGVSALDGTDTLAF